MPFKMPWEKVPLLLTRTTLPYISTPDLGDGVGRKDGFGDLVAQGYFIPKLKTKGVMVGVGYNLTIPTAGDNDYVGSGKWSIGPGAVYFNMKIPSWQWGFLGYSSFSFASANADRDHVANINSSLFSSSTLAKAGMRDYRMSRKSTTSKPITGHWH